jgi:hypothetical protein
MFGASILSWALAGAPESPPRIEVTTFDDAAEVVVYRGTDEPYAVLVVRAEGEEVRIDVDFADGLYLSAVDGAVESSDQALASARLMEIQRDLGPSEGWTERARCGFSVLVGAAACAAALITCPIDAAWAACHCLPELVSEWEDYSCPGL